MTKPISTTLFEGTEQDYNPYLSVTVHRDARFDLHQYGPNGFDAHTTFTLNREQAATLIAALQKIVVG